MDELKIRTKFMRTIVAKLIAREIKKKTGYRIDIRIDELEVQVIDDKAKVHLNVNAEIDTNELNKLTRLIGLEEES